MVSLKDFILIENKKDFDVKKFYADCEPFIEKIRGIREEYLPKHGSSSVPRKWDVRRVELVKKPYEYDTPTPAAIHFYHAVDNYFEERFGWRPCTRSMSTTGNRAESEAYGSSALCFPIGKNFQTLWSKDVRSLFGWLDSFKLKILREKFKKSNYDYFNYSEKNMFKVIPNLIDLTINELKKVRWHHNTSLVEGYEFGNEVLINADKVYLINMDSKEYDEVIDYLKSLRMIIA